MGRFEIAQDKADLGFSDCMDIFLLKDGQQIGPHSISEVRHRLEGGLSAVDDLAWHSGLSGWTAISEISEIGVINGPAINDTIPRQRTPPPREFPHSKEKEKEVHAQPAPARPPASLAKCPSCNSDVSVHAAACPKCGHQFKSVASNC